MNRIWMLAGPLLTALALPAAWAAGTATIEAGPDAQRMRAVVEYRNDALRMETRTQNGLPVVLVHRDATLYILANNLVLDARQAMRLLGQQVPLPATGPVDFSRFVALEPTPRKEIHAGIGGTVHVLRYADRDGRPREEEMVLSADARAVELSRAMLGVTGTARRSVELPTMPDEARLQAAIRGKGVLRFGREFRVVALDANPPPESRFDLPSLPLELPSFGGFSR